MHYDRNQCMSVKFRYLCNKLIIDFVKCRLIKINENLSLKSSFMG